MIEIKEVNKTYTSNQLHALKDVSFTVNKGDIFGLIGMSGAGKSTILRTLSLLETFDQGVIIVDGYDLQNMSKKDIAAYHKDMAVIFQGYNLLAQKTVFENVALPLTLSKSDQKVIEEKVMTMLAIVGLQGKEHEYVNKISGGQKQRVAIARALVCEPKILLCDEPTSALDSLTTAEVLKLLQEINQKMGVTILIITHEMNVVRKICNRLAVINSGEIVELGAVSEVFAAPKHAITKLLLGVEE